ncbi:MAG: hypothetical protein HC882_07900 [Acidobacteria bacterium]|nr:hypothetical protein [Acidobacteriota bacterium]
MRRADAVERGTRRSPGLGRGDDALVARRDRAQRLRGLRPVRALRRRGLVVLGLDDVAAEKAEKRKEQEAALADKDKGSGRTSSEQRGATGNQQSEAAESRDEASKSQSGPSSQGQQPPLDPGSKFARFFEQNSTQRLWRPRATTWM